MIAPFSCSPSAGSAPIFALGEPKLQQRRVEQLAREIPGEGPVRFDWPRAFPAQGRRSPAKHPGRRTRAPARSTKSGTPPGTPHGRQPGADTADNRAALRLRATGDSSAGVAKRMDADLGEPPCRRNAPLCDRNRLQPAAWAAWPSAGVVEAAIARLDQHFGLFDASPIILNAAHGGAGRDFANAVALVESDFDPPEMLDKLKDSSENSAGAGAGAGARACWISTLLCGAAAASARRPDVPHGSSRDAASSFSR